MTPAELFARHEDRLRSAIDANRHRHAYTPFIESPSRRHHPEGSKARGEAAFQARLHGHFELDQPGTIGWVGEEVSPYTGEPLGVRYPQADIEVLLSNATQARNPWNRRSPRDRVGICLELLDRWAASDTLFENAFATMHTGGQGFMLAFAGSGASSLDRGLEALAMAHVAMSQVPEHATFTRRFGGPPVTLDKRYHLRGVGVAAVVTCGSYPAWNAWPAVLANLATGNPVVLKPHPGGILPVAIAVEKGRELLAQVGADPNLLTLVADTPSEPATKALLQHDAVRIIDFTGSARFGAWIEQHCSRKQVYTETAGCNAVILDSVVELEPVLQAIARSLCMFSAQMCTAAQNIWLPQDGVRTAKGTVSAQEVIERLARTVDELTAQPDHAIGLCGTLQNPAVLNTLAQIQHSAEERGRPVVRRPVPISSPTWPKARTATPLIVALSPDDRDLYGEERFGPVGFVIQAQSRAEALRCAARDAHERGSIAAYGYTTDPDFADAITDAYVDAGASIAINLVGQSPINFTAAFSDFHVTGLNPAGTACLTDLGFVARRFAVVQTKTERPRQPASAATPE